LIAYLKKLKYSEREKEVIVYLTEFYSKSEALKNGMSIRINEIARMSFISQNFISNSSYLMLRSEDFLQFSNSWSLESTLFNGTAHNKSSSSSNDKNIENFKKSLENQIDQTFILKYHTSLYQLLNSSQFQSFPQPNQPTQQNWNWLEIIKLFEFYLLTDSSLLNPRFLPSYDSLVLNMNTKIFSENKLLYESMDKLAKFFTSSEITAQQPGKLTF
jgi:hypothetical protein